MSEKDVDAALPNKTYANSFRELIVYRKSVILAKELYLETLAFPKDEKFGLTDQLRRASRSIGAQIAEAWGKRIYERSFIAKLVDADAEQMETQHWILVAASCGYITRDLQSQYRAKCEEVGRLLGSMIMNASSFCRPDLLLVKEARGVYEVQPADDLDWLWDANTNPFTSDPTSPEY